MPMNSEIAPLLIMIQLEQYRLSGRDRDREPDAGGLVHLAARH